MKKKIQTYRGDTNQKPKTTIYVNRKSTIKKRLKIKHYFSFYLVTSNLCMYYERE